VGGAVRLRYISARAEARLISLESLITRLCRPPWPSLLIGGAVGLAVGLLVLDPRFISGTGPMWTEPQNDLVMYLVPLNYYLADAWRLPLFSIPAMGYPEGGSVLSNDALPLALLPTKLLHSLTGARVNPFGWWLLLTYALQGVMAARLLVAAGERSPWAALAAATFAVCCWSFLFRVHLGHVAVSSHFVILWALALHFESSRRERPQTLELFVLSATTLLVNPYLFVMVMAIVGATGLSLLSRGRLRALDFGGAALSLLGLAAIALLAGYGGMLSNPAQLQAEGYRMFSWNLLSLFVPPDDLLGWLPSVPRDATTGQFEGEAYIGDGALLLALIGALASPRRTLRAVRRHAWLCAVLALMAIYAASDRVYLGDRLVLAYDLPAFLTELWGYFRAAGRFIWPLAYSLMVLPVALVFRAWPRRTAIACALVAVVLQVADARPFLERGRAATSVAYPDLLGERVHPWFAQHERVWQYPSYGCGGLSGPERPFGSRDENRELQIQLAASRAGVPINSVLTSRLLKDCAAEAAWAREPTFESGTLYLIARTAVRDSPPLRALVHSHPCVALPWAIACSTRIGEERTPPPGGKPHP